MQIENIIFSGLRGIEFESVDDGPDMINIYPEKISLVMDSADSFVDQWIKHVQSRPIDAGLPSVVVMSDSGLDIA